MTWIALLRGINVGGHRKIPMKELKSTLEQAGLQNIQTYIQSGNVVLHSDLDESDLHGLLEKAILDGFGFPVQVVVRPAPEWQDVLAQNPFAEQTGHLHVAFLERVPETPVQDLLKPVDIGKDRWEVKGRNLYLFYPDGTANARLTHTVLERKLGVSATVRNWKTVVQLGQMLDA